MGNCRRSRRLALLLAILLLTLIATFTLGNHIQSFKSAIASDSLSSKDHDLAKKQSVPGSSKQAALKQEGALPPFINNNNNDDEDDDTDSNVDNQIQSKINDNEIGIPYKPKHFTYRQIFSLTTHDRKYFPIFFGSGESAYNPNIIPHPTKYDMWLVVAQHEQTNEQIASSQQLTCTAGFLNGVLVCSAEPVPANIPPSIPGQCVDDLAYFNFRNGPRDARVFYGPDAPYIIYGSQSAVTCLGLWLQDARMLLDGFRLERYMLVNLFKQATELHRPPPLHGIEKNYFLFWDTEGKTYAHYDLWPKRSFAQIDADGTVVIPSGDEGEHGDLALKTAEQDAVCMAKFMPTVGPSQESIHQATNSLLVTMCPRADKACIPSANNTFIMHVYHHKTYYDFHGVYEPHVILFQRDAPFAIHAISIRPFWIHGRSALTKFTGSVQYEGREEWIPEGHTEMFYVTSMSWKSHGQKYHGYIDDVLLIAFGIEDTRAGAIDVEVGDLLQDLAFCS